MEFYFVDKGQGRGWRVEVKSNWTVAREEQYVCFRRGRSRSGMLRLEDGNFVFKENTF